MIGQKNTITFLLLFLTCSWAAPDRRELSRLLLGGPATIENFPWLCTVVCCGPKPTRAVSAATLITPKLVVSSTENLRKNIQKPQTIKESDAGQYFRMKTSLKIICGSSFLQPNVPDALLRKYAPNRQIRQVKNLYFITDSQPFGEASSDQVLQNPDSYKLLKGNKFGNNFPLVFIEARKAFEVDAGPVQTIDPLMDAKWALKEMREREAVSEESYETSCLVAGWGVNQFNPDLQAVTRVVYQRVSYIKVASCTEAHCTADRDACFVFPPLQKPWDRLCAKALHYGDLCEVDRGAAMLCPYLDPEGGGIVFGILASTGKKCGTDGLPSVYMKIDQITKWRNFLSETYNVG